MNAMRSQMCAAMEHAWIQLEAMSASVTMALKQVLTKPCAWVSNHRLSLKAFMILYIKIMDNVNIDV